MLRKLLSKEEVGSPKPIAALVGEAADLAAALLRDYGAHAFDVEEYPAATIRERCEQWARHLLIGAPRPGQPADEPPSNRRDVAGLRQFFADLRRREASFVTRSAGALKQTVWSFIQALDGMVAQEDDVDEQLRGRLERLKRAAQDGAAPDLLRNEVVAAVEEIGHLSQERRRVLREKVAGLSGKVTELGAQLETARAEGNVDALTQLYNRKALDEKIEQLTQMSQLFGKPVTLLLIDLDRFKMINDTFGHVNGDVVLRHIADQLTRTFRVKTDFVARYGGEEFAALLYDTPLEWSRIAAGRLLKNLGASPIQLGDQSVVVTASVGAAQLGPGEGQVAWVERADRALYAAKQGGRNRVMADE